MNPENLCIYCMREKKRADGACEYCGKDPKDYQPSPHHLPPWTILYGRYLLGRVLGEGGFGITYVAYDLQKEIRVAIKELFLAGKVSRYHTKTVLVDRTPKGRLFYDVCKEKFLQEAEILYRLEDQRGVVSIYDFFESNDTAYIVMEYLEGDDLRTFVDKKGGRLSWRSTFQFLRPVMKSLIPIHEAGIIHRDISPDNIRYLNNKQMKLMDFGSAKQTNTVTSTSLILVKRGFASYEQYRTNFEVGPWMDVYSMAATFYRCITGKTPKEAIARKDNKDLESPSSMGISLPQEFEAALYKGMALRYYDRYIDMRSFYYALKEIVEREDRTLFH